MLKNFLEFKRFLYNWHPLLVLRIHWLIVRTYVFHLGSLLRLHMDTNGGCFCPPHLLQLGMGL